MSSTRPLTEALIREAMDAVMRWQGVKTVIAPPDASVWEKPCRFADSCWCPCDPCRSWVHKCGHVKECHWHCKEE